MKKIYVLMTVILICLLVFSGCASNNDAAPPAETASDQAQEQDVTEPATDQNKDADAAESSTSDYKVLCLLNGNLGDKSFFDSANNGMTMITDELGIETKVVEMGFDATKWEPALLEASEQGDWSVIIVGTYQMQEILQEIAPQFPDQKYIIFDSEVAADNVYSMTYKQNDGSYLAGIVAAGVTEAQGGDPLVGFVGGMDIPVINDFLVGYIQGVSDNYPDTKIMNAYVGDFSDTAKAKELTMAQYSQGAGVVFHAAAQAGLGVLDAAKDKSMYVIGSDADQSAIFEEQDPEKAKLVISSMMKNVDNSLVRAIKLDLEGNLPYGTTEALGIAEGAVGLAKNDAYFNAVPEDIQQQVEQAEADIRDGKITVKSAFDMSTEELNEYKNTVAP